MFEIRNWLIALAGFLSLSLWGQTYAGPPLSGIPRQPGAGQITAQSTEFIFYFLDDGRIVFHQVGRTGEVFVIENDKILAFEGNINIDTVRDSLRAMIPVPLDNRGYCSSEGVCNQKVLEMGLQFMNGERTTGVQASSGPALGLLQVQVGQSESNTNSPGVLTPAVDYGIKLVVPQKPGVVSYQEIMLHNRKLLLSEFERLNTQMFETQLGVSNELARTEGYYIGPDFVREFARLNSYCWGGSLVQCLNRWLAPATADFFEMTGAERLLITYLRGSLHQDPEIQASLQAHLRDACREVNGRPVRPDECVFYRSISRFVQGYPALARLSQGMENFDRDSAYRANRVLAMTQFFYEWVLRQPDGRSVPAATLMEEARRNAMLTATRKAYPVGPDTFMPYHW